MNKVFLGGTNKSTWRDDLIEKLDIDYFNPIVDDWTEECIREEERQKWSECNIHLYVFTPEQYGFYSFTELVDSLYKTNTIYVFSEGFDEAKIKSLNAIGQKVKEWHGMWISDNDDGSLSDITRIAEFVNNT